MAPYRESEPSTTNSELKCPRCTAKLPPLDVAACAKGCGSWLSAFAATEVLSEDERRANRVTQWWKVRAPCPMCGDKMILRGATEHHFLGCDGHGFWIDAEDAPYTGLANGVDLARLEHKRDDDARMHAEQEARTQAEQQRDLEHATKQLSEQALDHKIADRGFVAGGSPPPDPPSTMGGLSWSWGVAGDLGVAIAALRQLTARVDALEAHNRELAAQIAELKRGS